MVTPWIEPWIEYNVDFMPDDLRVNFNGGIGGYVSQRALCTKLKPCAPRTDEELIPLLCDLLVVSSPQLHGRLRREIDDLTISQVVKKEFFHNRQSLGMFEGVVKKRFDDTNVYRIEYNDGDIEDYTIEELLPILQVDQAHREKVKSAHRDLVDVLAESKKSDRDEYFFRVNLLTKDKAWFGSTLRSRRELSCSLMNFCVFQHAVGECTCDNGVRPWTASTADKPCVFRHEPTVCKCDQVAIKLSQDETTFAAYSLQRREWRMQGKHTLRKKAPGTAIMVSDYASFEFGLGIKVSAATLTDINRLRAGGEEYYEEGTHDGKQLKKKPLMYYPESDSITVHLIQPGENKDGWWSLPKILHQCEDVLDVLRVVAPPRLYQYIPYYDNSSIHNKREDLTLSTSKLNAQWGGKQVGLRDSKLLPGCVGPHEALMWYLPGQGSGEWRGGPKWVIEGTVGAICKDFTLSVGDVDYARFQPDDPPPFYDLKAQRYDRDMTATEKQLERDRFKNHTTTSHHIVPHLTTPHNTTP